MFLCYCIYQKIPVSLTVMQAPHKESSANAVFLYQPFHSVPNAGFSFS